MEDRFETIPEASSDIGFQLIKGWRSVPLNRGQWLPPRLSSCSVDVFPIFPIQQPGEDKEHHQEQ